MGVKAGARAEAKELRKALAREMFADCEADLKIEKQAAMRGARRITTLEGRVQLLEAELQEGEKARSKLLAHIEVIEATDAAVQREKVEGLERALQRAVSDLNQAGRLAANASAATAEVKEEAAKLGLEKDDFAEKVERLQSERDGLQETLAALKDELGDASTASSAQISQLREEVAESKRQLQSVISVITIAKDTPEA